MATPARRRGSRGARAVAVALSAAVLATSAVGYAAVARFTGEIKHTSVFAGINEDERPAEGPSINILMVGSDNREGLTRTQQAKLHVGSGDYGPARTDTIMILHVAKDGGGATVVSLPRDSYVTIPAHKDSDGVEHEARQNKINAAFEIGGPQLLVRTVEQATGLRMDHYIEVNFAGFLTMVDALDGIPVCLTQAVKDKDSGLDLPAGRQTVSGKQALAYVRARHLDSDFGRMSRQQKFIASMLQKATSAGVLLNPLKLNGFLDAATQAVTTDDGLGREQMLDLANRLRGVDQGSIAFMTVPVADDDYRVQIGQYNQSTVKWDDTAAKALFTKLANDEPIVKAVKGKPLTVAPEKIRVTVLNGAGITGLASKATEDFDARGYITVGNPANADTSGATTTVVRYDPTMAEAQRTLAKALPKATFTAVEGFGSTFEVTLGSDYTGVAAVTVKDSVATTTDVKSPTKVRTAAQDICG